MKQDEKTSKRRPKVDKPSEFCCEALEYAVDIGSITYYEPLDEFRLIRVKGVGGMYLNHCPWCGEGIPSLRALRVRKDLEYDDDLEDEDFDLYWHIIREDLDHGETLRLIAEEKRKVKPQKRMGITLERLLKKVCVSFRRYIVHPLSSFLSSTRKEE